MDFIETFLMGMTPSKVKRIDPCKNGESATHQTYSTSETSSTLPSSQQQEEAKIVTRSIARSQSLDIPSDLFNLDEKSRPTKQNSTPQNQAKRPEHSGIPDTSFPAVPPSDSYLMDNILTLSPIQKEETKENTEQTHVTELERGRTYNEIDHQISVSHQIFVDHELSSDLDKISEHTDSSPPTERMDYTNTNPSPNPEQNGKESNGNGNLKTTQTAQSHELDKEPDKGSLTAVKLGQLTQAISRLEGKLKECNDSRIEETIKLKAQNATLAQAINIKIHEATTNLNSELLKTKEELDDLKTNQQINPSQLKQIKKLVQDEARLMFQETRKFLENKLGKQISDEIEVLRNDFRNKTSILATDIDNNSKQINDLSARMTTLATETANSKQNIRGVMDTLASHQPIDQEHLTSQMKREILELQKSLTDLQKTDVNETSGTTQQFHTTPSRSPEIKLINTRIEQASKTLLNHQRQIGVLEKKMETLDNRSRRKNIVIDCLPENPQENLRWETEQLFSSIAPGFEVEWLDSIYRIGSPRADGSPRRVFASLTSQFAKEYILMNSYKLAHNNSVKLYLNEDFTDESKRRRNDIHKYVDYMNQNNHRAEKKGEAAIVDGKWYSYDELELLPQGQRLSDSRTIKRNGVVAFQSEHSPLSNLYPCQIKQNGLVYNSAEQAYQYQKATFHHDTRRASRILKETSPYEIMAIAREIKDSPQWREKQIEIMTDIIKAKMEQVLPFKELLKSTGSHHLVENSRNYFWACGCTYNSDLIFIRNYPGQNNMGKLLEFVRDNF